MPTPNNPPARHASPVLCYVTDRRSFPSAEPTEQLSALLQKIEELTAAAIDWIQIREKDLSARHLAALTRRALQIAAKHSPQTRILLNDRLDVALVERAGGAHLGEEGLPVAEARRLIQTAQAKGSLSEDFLLGVSCHSSESVKAAAAGGADYILFGPVFPTPSKEKFGPPQGIDRLRDVCRLVSLPVFAIGGITSGNAKSCIAAGAAGISAIRLFQDAPHPRITLEKLHRLPMGSRQ